MSNRDKIIANNTALQNNQLKLGKILTRIQQIPAEPTGTLEITENGIYDVKDKANVDVNVQGGGDIEEYFSISDNTYLTRDGMNASQYWAGWTKLMRTLPKNLKMPYTVSYMFSRYIYFKDWSFLGTWDFSEVTNCSYMFWNNTAVEELDLNGFNSANISNAVYMFYGCTNLKKLNLKNMKPPTSGYTHMFDNVSTTCEIITNQTFADWMTSHYASYTNITIVKADWEV